MLSWLMPALLAVEEGHRSFTGPRVTVPIGEYRPGDELAPEVTPGNYSLGRCIALIARLLDQVQPQLCVFSGDIIDGRMCSDHVRAMAEVVAPCQERGVPWCFTPGNHDDDPCASPLFGVPALPETKGKLDWLSLPLP